MFSLNYFYKSVFDLLNELIDYEINCKQDPPKDRGNS